MRANTGEQLREVAAALKQDQRNYLHEVMQGKARIAELEAENAELKRDAERYRWLRDCHGHDGQKNLTICEVFKWSLEPWSGDDPDRAIDAAIAKHKEQV